MSHGLIDPSKLPGHNLDLAGVSQAAADISSRAGSIQQGGTDVASSWSTLPASYESTGAEAVYVAMNPVRDASDRVGGDLTAVASALTDWVTTVQPILTRLADLRSDAEAFVVEANTFQSRVTSTGNLAVAFLPVQVDNWWEDPDMVQRNADLVDQGYLLGEQLRVANEDLANAIRRSAGLSASTVAPAATSAPDDLQTDWGSASAREESCAEKTIGFPMHLTGGVLNGAWDMVGGLGMLVSGYDFKSWPPPAWGVLGDMLSGDLQGAADRGGDWLYGWGQSWLGLGHLVTGVSMGFMAPVMTEVVAPGQISELKAKGIDTGFVEWQQQWMRDSYRSYIDLFGSFVGYHAPEEWWKATPDQWGEGWSDWGKDPGGTAGTSLFNIATLVLPTKGGGALLDGLKGGRGAEGLGDDVGRGGAVERPSGSAPESNGLHLRSDGVADDGARFGSAQDDLANTLERSSLDDGGTLLNDIRGGDHLVRPDADVPRVRAGEPDVPPFHLGDPDAPAVHHGGGDAPSTPHPTVSDGPGENFAHQAPDAGTPGPDHTSHLRITDEIAAGRDPMHNGSSGVPGEWQRLPDLPGKPEDALYGQPHTEHGHASLPPHPQGNARSGYDLFRDPGAPYGRHPDGTPLTNAEYDARYVTSAPENWDRYPPNEGAVHGTRVGYTDPQAFIRDYGAQLDRVGETNGKYLGLRPDGAPATFEERGLPLGSLEKTVRDYTLTGYLPEGFRIEISEIAPAFGREGGGFQLLIRNDEGSILTIDELDELGVIE